MYGSLRIYIDKWDHDIGATSILDIINMFSLGLGAPFSRLIHVLYSPDEDRPKVYVEYTNDESGRNAFISSEFISEFTGKYGDVSAPSVKATCACDSNEVYSGISIEVQLPCGRSPMILRVDFDLNFISIPLELSTYTLLLSNLYSMGYRVNNSFFHVYRKRKTVVTLDGGQIGSFISFEEKRNIKQSIAHRKNGEINRIFDVFYINSIRRSQISKAARDSIIDIVGNNCTANVADNFVFSLPISTPISFHYRHTYSNIVKKLRMIATSHGLIS